MIDNTALFKIGYGLYVLSAREDGKDNGCIINTLMQVTSNPLTVLIAVNKQNYTHDMILRTGLFNVSMLTEQAPFEVFWRFGFQSGKNVDKLQGFESTKRSENGLIYLSEHANAYLSGKVIDTIDCGTHTIFRAEVTEAQAFSQDPSVTYTYYQANIKLKPQPTGKRGWRCNICGYIYEGDPLPPDFICPICKHGAVDFTKIE